MDRWYYLDYCLNVTLPYFENIWLYCQKHTLSCCFILGIILLYRYIFEKQASL